MARCIRCRTPLDSIARDPICYDCVTPDDLRKMILALEAIRKRCTYSSCRERRSCGRRLRAW